MVSVGSITLAGYSVMKTTHKADLYPDGTIEDEVVTRRRVEMQEVERLVNVPPIPGDQVLLLYQEIDLVYGSERLQGRVKTFWDNGSTCSLVSNSTAERLQLSQSR